ncbi:MAG: outer membrane protein assembly factor BamD [PVC group bacterium]|nr:outer membrane protein assembly factor BamD [PVC group bacterium]
MKKTIVILLLLFVTNIQVCFAYWVWTPGTQKWVNPLYKTFDTPQEQFDWAKRYFDAGDYRKAIYEFKKILRKFPKTEYAPEAKYFMGLCEEKRGRHYHAFKIYQEVIDIYPLNDRLESIVEQQYLIGEVYFKRRKYELAEEIFQKSLLNSPYSKVADVAQYKIGLCSFRLRRFNEARDEFDKISENYSFSPYLDDAGYYSALCSFKISSLIKDYDEEILDRAHGDLNNFLARAPTSEYVAKAESLKNKLVNKKAEKLFKTARFYEKLRKTYAALKYYEELVYSYEKTTWALQAKPKLERLRAQR